MAVFFLRRASPAYSYAQKQASVVDTDHSLAPRQQCNDPEPNTIGCHQKQEYNNIKNGSVKRNLTRSFEGPPPVSGRLVQHLSLTAVSWWTRQRQRQRQHQQQLTELGRAEHEVVKNVVAVTYPGKRQAFELSELLLNETPDGKTYRSTVKTYTSRTARYTLVVGSVE